MTQPPSFLKKKPQPVHKQRRYHGRKLMVWEGVVNLDEVKGWPDNPRIGLAIETKKAVVGDRDLTQEEIFEIMKCETDIKLNDLRDNIAMNGVRIPITLTAAGKLLDGNRRYFAAFDLLSGMAVNDSRRSEFSTIPVYVLDESCTEDDEKHILVQENFVSSYKERWPDNVKAIQIRAEIEAGATIEEVAKIYGWTNRQVRETVRIGELVDEFMDYAVAPKSMDDDSAGGLGLTATAAKQIVKERYQHFNEAQKSLYDDLKMDYEFKFNFFRWMYEGKFRRFDEIRIAYKAWKDEEARPHLESNHLNAAKDAKAILDYNNRLKKGMVEVPTRITEFVRFLGGLTSEQMSKIPDESISNLQQALDRVVKMTQAVRHDKS